MYRPISVFIFFMLATFAFAEEVVLDREEFIRQAFADQAAVEMKTLWVNKDVKKAIAKNIDYSLSGLRVRYWASGMRTAWVLEEIGKERPITMGVVVENDSIVDIKILVYRESRGGEVQYPFFTQQFPGAVLIQKRGKLKLDKSIDNITGATLSVRAVKKIAAVALFLDRQISHQQVVGSSE